ncbi:MAG: F0F1 ATP synthase subunit [Gammaproteobacteria bacterium]|nr:F0F1 ATP synthase subunit [Gammaproteobacteria bacterium]
MSEDDELRRLREKVRRQAGRLKQAERNRNNWLAQTAYIGTLGLAFVLPVIAGAYLGRWLDERLQDYSMSWTISLIFVGVVVGAINVYLMIRE